MSGNGSNTVAVIGGGPAGLLAAGTAGRYGGAVTVFERNEKTGKKLYITGKGRCNVTNACDPAAFLKNVVTNPKFLYSAIYSFTPDDTIALLEKNGLHTKIERGNRVFPVSDHASDVTKALTKYAQDAGTVRLNAHVSQIRKEGERFCLLVAGETLYFDKVVVATGGLSYPSTGSDGDGYVFARRLGHTIIEPRPALVPIHLRENVTDLEGLSLKNVTATVTTSMITQSAFGEMLFTADGVSGPIILTLSSRLARADCVDGTLSIDLKPALTREKLDVRLLSDFGKYANKTLKNALIDLLPKSLIPYVIAYAQLQADKPIHSITAAERSALLDASKNLRFTIAGFDTLERAVVTSGGIAVSEINPKTMESKLVPGLYFAGEVIDTDALTGGFNIQIALSTGYAAGKYAGGAV